MRNGRNRWGEREGNGRKEMEGLMNERLGMKWDEGEEFRMRSKGRGGREKGRVTSGGATGGGMKG